MEGDQEHQIFGIQVMKILIRAVQERLSCVSYLREHLLGAEFVFDTTKNAMDTFLRAMLMAGQESCVHMEEDIYITRGFTDKLNKVLAGHSNEVVQFFSMRKGDIVIGSRYDSGRTFMMNQCFYLPAGYSRMIHDYYPLWPQKEIHKTGYDIMIADFLKSRKERYFISVPSLVQHRRGISVINPRRPRARQSQTFVDGLYE